jgi:predicted aspartyl protease
MMSNRFFGALLGVAVMFCSLGASAPPAPSLTDRAQAAYLAGDFGTAQADFAQAVAVNPDDPVARLGLGRIELYGNQLDRAQVDLQRAIDLHGDAAAAQRLLAGLRMRRAGAAAYDNVLTQGIVRIPFVQRDPLPMIAVKADGVDALFLIDTGAPTVVIDPDFAKELGVQARAAGTGTFAGGRQAPVSAAVLPHLTLGSVTLDRVRVNVLPTRELPFGNGRRIDGVLGTGVLMHFLSTLDYGGNQLMLRPRGATMDTAGATIVPMWLVGDHFMFARGSINDAPVGLLLVDTGLAGGGVMPSAAEVNAAHIALDRAHAGTGIGGGGPVTIVPFVAARVSLGSFVRQNVSGSYTPEGSPLGAFPFKVDGVVSHQFFSPGSITFDFAAMQLRLTP